MIIFTVWNCIHGPTLAFKDVGGRFMSRLLGYFIQKQGENNVKVLVATSGDTGSAVANGFLGVEAAFMCMCCTPKGWLVLFRSASLPRLVRTLQHWKWTERLTIVRHW